ncbi:MAG: hypothetical protein LUG18_04115 [Candidatus Azobacteroides sp.]|nr:hypothetical protein [Candidatus Azobacteroides sp.]
MNGEIRHVFLEYLLQGIVDLYSYTDNEFTYFIFEKEDGTMQYVTQNPEKIEDNKIIPDLSYRNKVRRALGDCYPAVYDAAKLKFTPKDMIHITKVYHDNMCDTGEECIIFENEEIGKTYFQTKYSIYLGMQQFKYKFGIITDHFTSTYSPTIGFQMNFIFPRWTHAFSVQTDFSFSKIKDVNRRYMGISKGNPKHIVADYKMYSFTGKIGGKYVFQTSGIRPVIEAGAVVSFLIDPYCIIKEETFYSDTNSSHINSGIKYEMQKIFPGAYAGIGFDYLIGKEHSLFFRIVFDRYLKIDINDNDDMNMMHMKLGYNF